MRRFPAPVAISDHHEGQALPANPPPAVQRPWQKRTFLLRWSPGWPNSDAVPFGLTWTRDGKEILFTEKDQILRVRLAGGEPEPVAGVGRNTRGPSVLANRMVYVQATAPPFDIWRSPGRR